MSEETRNRRSSIALIGAVALVHLALITNSIVVAAGFYILWKLPEAAARRWKEPH